MNAKNNNFKVARVYLRVSTAEQDLTRQERIRDEAEAQGYYVAGTYSEKGSGALAERPELDRLINDLQPGEVIIAEKIDRISRLPLPEAEKLVARIRARGAKLAIPGIVDLSEMVDSAKGTSKVILESTQEMLLKVALQMARDDYEVRRDRQRQGIDLAKQAGRYTGRPPNPTLSARVLRLRGTGHSIADTAQLAGCSISQVKRIQAANRRSCEGRKAAG